MRKAKRKNPYKNPKCKDCIKYGDLIFRCEKHFKEYENWIELDIKN